MSAAEQAKTRADLLHALDANLFPSDAAETAKKIINRLDTPVRVGVFGLPGTGKSSLINLLLGQNVIPEGVHLPTAEIVQGDQARATLTLQDGSTKTIQSTDLNAIAAERPIFVRLELPLQALNRISVMELATSDNRVDQMRGLMWACKRTDIALWTTQFYDSAEHLLWQDVPDNVKDHAVLVRSKADLIGPVAQWSETMSQIDLLAEEHFAYRLPLATLEAIAARKPDGSVDKPALRASGGIGLISTLMRQIDLGYQSAVDQGAILLHKHRPAKVQPSRPVDLRNAAEATVKHAPTPEPEVVEPEAAPAATPAVSEPVEPPVAESVESVADRLIASKASKVSTPDDTASKEAQMRLAAATRATFESALGTLERCGEAMLADNEPSSLSIIRDSDAVLTELGDMFEDGKLDGAEPVSDLRESILEAQDMVQLLHLEATPDAAIDAASLLVQLRRMVAVELAQ